jgi:hypothetical protein
MATKTIERKTCHGRERLAFVDNALVWPPGSTVTEHEIEIGEARLWQKFLEDQRTPPLASVNSANSDERK